MLITASIEATDFIIKRLHGKEEISLGYNFSCHMYTKAKTAQCENLVGKRCSFSLGDSQLNGMVCTWKFLYLDLEGNSHYSCSFTSSFQYYFGWEMSKVYENTDLEQLIAKLFKKHSLRYNFLASIGKNYDYLCQYKEPTSTFIRRLADWNSIYFNFDHKNNYDTMNFYTHQHEPPIILEYTTNEKSIDLKFHNFVYEWSKEYRNRPNLCTSTDSNVSNPLTSAPKQSRSEETYSYGEMKVCGGDASPQRILNQYPFQECHYTSTKCPLIRAGSRVSLAKHGEYDGEYHVLEVRHDYDGDIYHNECTLGKFGKFISKDVPLNRIYGMEVATVVADRGVEVDQKEGKIRIRFHWDDESECSAYVPALQSVAGNGFGFYALPRAGQLVSVMFESGDPSRPFVCGSFYNGAHLPPYDEDYLTGIKTKTMRKGDYNELVLSDQPGKQYIKLATIGDLIEDVNLNKTITLHEGDMNVQINRGNYSIRLDSNAKSSHEISLQNGDSSVKIANGSYDVSVSEGEVRIDVLHGDISYKIKDGKLSIDAPIVDINCSAVRIKSDEVTVTGDSIKLNSSGAVQISGDEIKINSVKEVSVASRDINFTGGDMIQLKGNKIKLN